MALTFGLRRALTCCLRTEAGLLSNEALLTGQPDGDLRSFFSASYATEDEVERAFRDAGGSIIVRPVAGEVTTVGFVLEGNKPGLRVAGGKGCIVELRLAIPHSITH